MPNGTRVVFAQRVAAEGQQTRAPDPFGIVRQSA
jgi:hypothetical protein